MTDDTKQLVPARDAELIVTPASNAEKLNAQWHVLRSSADHMLEQAMIFGEMLIEQQKLMEHGDWQPWIDANCDFGYDSAASYMRLARNKQKFSALNFSSIRRALAYLYEEKQKSVPESKFIKRSKPKSKKSDADLELEELEPEQRKLVKRIIESHDLLRTEKFNTELTAAVEKAVAKRMTELDAREAELTAREQALDKREEELAVRKKEAGIKRPKGRKLKNSKILKQ